jgi:hypothetical protein
MKKALSLILALAITSSCITSAFAAESSNYLYSSPDANEVIDATTGSSNEFTEFEHTPVMLTNPADIPVEVPTGNIIEDNPTDKMQTTLSRANLSAVYGPYTTLSLSDDKMQVIVYGLKTGGPLSAVSYNNQNCFKFTYGGNTIYVTTATFFKTQSPSLSASLSSAISNNINTSNSNYVYSTAFKSYQYTYNGMTVYRWSFARIGVRAFQYSNAEMIASCKIDTAYDFDVYQYSMQDIATTSSMVISPTLSMSVANTGSNSLYFGGYKLTGTGNTSSSTDISTIIDLGYKTAQAVGAVASGLSFASFYSLYQTTVGLIRSTSGGRSTYNSDISPLSSGNKYSYSCSTTSPFNIMLTNDLYTLSIGFIGTKTSTTNFSGSFSCSIS